MAKDTSGQFLQKKFLLKYWLRALASLISFVKVWQRVISAMRGNSPLSPLTVQHLIDFNTASMVYDSVHGNCPEHLTGIFVPAQHIHTYDTKHAQN